MLNSVLQKLFRGPQLIPLLLLACPAAILALAMVPGRPEESARDRDRVRVMRMLEIADAIRAFNLDRGRLPLPRRGHESSGWEASTSQPFMRELERHGYLERVPLDPLNSERHHFRYSVFSQGAYDCKGQGPYWILALTHFETDEYRARYGDLISCTGRNWSESFEFTLGGGAEFTRRSMPPEAALGGGFRPLR